MKRFAIYLIYIFLSLPINAQTQPTWEQYLYDLAQIDGEGNYTNEATLELLTDLAEHPINLNTATREDLERIPFLNAIQIEELLAYVYQYHGMETLGELAMIESLDVIRRQLLAVFVYVEKVETKDFPSLKNILKYGKHEVMFTAKLPLYNRKGDRNGYLGYKYPHSLRYTFQYSDYVKASLIGSQDAGEPFFSNKNSIGYDHYSFYVLIKKLGFLKTLAIGRYKVSLGQGLVINNSFGFGKLAMLQTLGRQSNIIRGHSSRSSYNYLQGVAATVALNKHIDLTGFVSYRHIDATLNKKGYIQTVLASGYHRTKTEMAKKNNASQFASGVNAKWTNGGFHLGVSALFTSFNKPLQPDTKQAYKRYAPQDNNFWNVSVDYGYLSHRWNLQGETATNNAGGIATMNALSWRATNSLTLLSVQRYYGHKYYSLFSRGFSDSGHIQNENGVLFGATWNPLRGLSLMAYTDIVQFSHPKYGAHIGSKAWDSFLSAIYTYGKITLSARLRYKVTEKDGAKKKGLIRDITQRSRIAFAYMANKWSSKTQADLVINDYKTHSLGYMVSENFSYIPCQWLSMTATIGYFHTDSYASRIYTYERGPLYSFNFPSFYGEGMRYAFFARAAIRKNLIGIVRLSTTQYFDRNSISSSYQKINASAMTDIDIQVRWKF